MTDTKLAWGWGRICYIWMTSDCTQEINKETRKHVNIIYAYLPEEWRSSWIRNIGRGKFEEGKFNYNGIMLDKDKRQLDQA